MVDARGAGGRGRRAGRAGSTSCTRCRMSHSIASTRCTRSRPRSVSGTRSVIARGLHVVTIVGLAAVGVASGAGWLYDAGVAIAAVLLAYEHSLMQARRPVAARRGILHDERHYQRRVLRIRRRRAARQQLGTVSPRVAAGRRSAPPLVVAITGASGAPYAVRLLQLLAAARRPVSLIVSSHGYRLLQTETGIGTQAGLRRAVGAARWDAQRHRRSTTGIEARRPRRDRRQAPAW